MIFSVKAVRFDYAFQMPRKQAKPWFWSRAELSLLKAGWHFWVTRLKAIFQDEVSEKPIYLHDLHINHLKILQRERPCSPRVLGSSCHEALPTGQHWASSSVRQNQLCAVTSHPGPGRDLTSWGIPGILCADFNSQEACQAPQYITQSLVEALPHHHSLSACFSGKAAVTGACQTMENAFSLITQALPSKNRPTFSGQATLFLFL